MQQKLAAGAVFPNIEVALLGGGHTSLAQATKPYDWRLVVVYRGKHCPKCTGYLKTLNELLPEFHAQNVDVIAVSSDTQEKAAAHMEVIEPTFPVAYGLTIEQMQSLGLYISNPRSAAETDAPFAEPGLFVINADGQVQLVDISNAPFLRPDLAGLAAGIAFIRKPESNYPIRGTYV
ncbi:peroxiredoxin-like family protein [Reinekea thalattae]|uniref:AhpC/TSA family protein n=1 Tax=Reinekea thalattae TaxID=2593301 RepID=A0A5C8Z6Z8_9GAMM|nr:peroxiredoxin-like family protein [Reinekea thalattae]TXR53064.1 AhpC/TSA family protein [Reinekea thalattae]